MATARRHRPSSIDLLPAEAEADVAWAIGEIEAGGRLQIDIHAEFNARLADRGIGPISHSAFSRYALRKRMAFTRLREVREISNAITAALGPGDDDALTTAIAQLIKTRAYELLEGGNKVDTKGAMELARAVQAIGSAQKTSAEHRSKLEAGIRAKLEKAVDAAESELAASGASAADGAEVLRKIRQDIYGIFEK
ncbi:phage protein Gp27 family protein [Mesorhizobium sp. DCY119]|uniref:phage protein Gp27 family protein n=1 Tax=Mesorhizobium sp. DCY119 TaxID=2108445 RepID=UPI000E6CE2E2|nr:phage protein Gp27 family protein [Mesorhizobium sp. DCY119]RJG46453.1 DUF3486 family protein [Mesorhizobium sp. DCY119]